mmetsp:Transcript_40681/g.77682  ORF Transcript_40681/g.77682 Transcript_40681/m.77682 type:complete len:614 (+) Transcript_40681:129-1970(+)
MSENWWEAAEDDEEVEQRQEYESFKEYIVFLIDGSECMFQTSGDQPCCFDKAIDCALSLLRHKIICSGSDEISVCFFGTREKQNNLGYNHVFCFQDLDAPDAHYIHALEGLQTKRGTEFNDSIGSECKDRGKALEQGLRVASNLMAKGTQGAKRATKRVLLFTNDDDPCKGGPDAKQGSLIAARVESMREGNQQLQIMGMRTPTTSFDLTKFYKSIQPDSSQEAMAETLENLQNAVRRKFTPKRRLKALWMDVCGARVAVGLYATVSEATKGGTVQLEADTLEELLVESAYICQDTGMQLTEINKVFYEYAGEKVVLQTSEVADVKLIMPEVGLKVIGFVPTSELLDFYQVKRSSFIYPDEEIGQGSTRAFIALHQAMIRLDRCAVVWAQTTSSTAPRMAVLMAQNEQIDDIGQREPPGMNLVYLPFLNDIRQPEKEEFEERGWQPPKATPDMTRAAKNLIDSWQLEDFDCRDVLNPALQKHYTMLENLALGYEEALENALDVDGTLPDVEGMQSAEGAVQLFKDQVFGASHNDEEEAAAQRNSEKKGAKRKADTVDSLCETSVNWKQHVTAGTIKKLTVNVLKSYLTANNLSTVGKKDELVDRVTQHVVHAK